MNKSPEGTAHEPYLHLNLVSHCVLDERTPASYCRTSETMDLHGGRGSQSGLRSARDWGNTKPRSPARSVAIRRVCVASRAEAEIQFVALASRKRTLARMAGRLRCFLGKRVECGCCEALHSEPGGASSATQFRSRVCGLVEKVRRSVQSGGDFQLKSKSARACSNDVRAVVEGRSPKGDIIVAQDVSPGLMSLRRASPVGRHMINTDIVSDVSLRCRP